MIFNDRLEFSKKLKEVATVVGRTIDDEDTRAYFNQLEEYPIKLVLKGMDRALRDRDPNDEFLKTMLVTVPEIRTAIEDITRPMEDQEGRVSTCKKCNGNGWLTSEDKLGRLIARPCECLYQVTKETLKKKGKKMSHLDAYRKRIINAYKYYQKQWGPGSGIKEKEL